MNRLLMILATALFIIGCGSNPKPERNKTADLGLTIGESNEQTPDDRQQLFDLCKKRAEDAFDLKIVELSEPKEMNAGRYSRRFRIRCQRVGTTPKEVTNEQGVVIGEEIPRPINEETGTALYDANGRLYEVKLDTLKRVWYP
ncbi:MAG: hypothetical protein KatS3mg105_4823 [Gemmatales bacterium]|nr:MAG: hypothetical protein KatS3mg105_4823 [Gemmatales bacterium]